MDCLRCGKAVEFHGPGESNITCDACWADMMHPELVALPVPVERFDLRAPSFTQRSDGSVVLNDPWPEELDVTLDLLDRGMAALLRRDGLRMHIACANGEAEYRITGYDRLRLTVRAARLYAKTWEKAA